MHKSIVLTKSALTISKLPNMYAAAIEPVDIKYITPATHGVAKKQANFDWTERGETIGFLNKLLNA